MKRNLVLFSIGLIILLILIFRPLALVQGIEQEFSNNSDDELRAIANYYRQSTRS